LQIDFEDSLESQAHGKPPQFAILNHDAIDSGIPGESATQRVGISPQEIPADTWKAFKDLKGMGMTEIWSEPGSLRLH
jgi:hypothetical protein